MKLNASSIDNDLIFERQIKGKVCILKKKTGQDHKPPPGVSFMIGNRALEFHSTAEQRS